VSTFRSSVWKTRSGGFVGVNRPSGGRSFGSSRVAHREFALSEDVKLTAERAAPEERYGRERPAHLESLALLDRCVGDAVQARRNATSDVAVAGAEQMHLRVTDGTMTVDWHHVEDPPAVNPLAKAT